MSGLDVKAQPQVSHCQPHSLQHCPELEWALGLDCCSILLRGNCTETGQQQQDPMALPGTHKLVAGDTGTVLCFLHPIICVPKTPVCSVARCQCWDTP